MGTTTTTVSSSTTALLRPTASETYLSSPLLHTTHVATAAAASDIRLRDY